MFRILFLAFLTLISFAFAAPTKSCNHSLGTTDNQLMPLIKLQLTPQPLGSHVAFSLQAEGGHKDYRLGGTLGVLFGEIQRFKVSGEYLTQKLGYKFSTGKVDAWMKQLALGALYEVDFFSKWMKNVQASAFYSHAPSKALSLVNCSEACEQIKRRIVGSFGGGGALGGTISFWRSGRFQLHGNYDAISYQRKYHPHKHVNGFGGSLNWVQQLGRSVDFKLGAELRHPFNFYEGALNFRTNKKWEGFSIGVFGSHTQGKHQLPNNNTLGLNLSCTFGDRFFSQKTEKEREEKCPTRHLDSPFCSTLLSFVSTPAVYMPEVLALADERRITGTCGGVCVAPTSVPIPDLTVMALEATFDASPFFTDESGTHPLTFTLSSEDPTKFSIDANTGIITGMNFLPGNIYSFFVIAHNACGSTYQLFTIIVDVT